MLGGGKNPATRGDGSSEPPGRWLARGLLGAVSVASCLCATTPPPAAVSVAAEALAGDWLFEVTRGGEPIQFSLHLAVDGGVLAGSLTGPDGNVRELSRIALKEGKVSWDVAADALTLHYEGTVSGASMKGTVRRTGGRRSGGRGDAGEGSAGTSEGDGGGFRGGGMRGRGRRGSRGGGAQAMSWSAYKSVTAAPGEKSSPQPTPPTPTPAPSGD